MALFGKIDNASLPAFAVDIQIDGNGLQRARGGVDDESSHLDNVAGGGHPAVDVKRFDKRIGAFAKVTHVIDVHADARQTSCICGVRSRFIPVVLRSVSKQKGLPVPVRPAVSRLFLREVTLGVLQGEIDPGRPLAHGQAIQDPHPPVRIPAMARAQLVRPVGKSCEANLVTGSKQVHQGDDVPPGSGQTSVRPEFGTRCCTTCR